MDVEMVDDDGLMTNLSKCNDIVNAFGNSCKRLVKCEDDTIILLNQEGGVTRKQLNSDLEDCKTKLSAIREDPMLPWVFTSKFREDIMGQMYRECLPTVSSKDKDLDIELFCKSLLPGLTTLRRTLRQMLAETSNDSLSSEEISKFFGFTCTHPMCASKVFRETADIPPPNVSHPMWLYNTNTPDYIQRTVMYIRDFNKRQVSKRCTACDLYFRLTEGEDAVDLFGLPEQFVVNDSICSLYGMFKIDNERDFFYDLRIAEVPRSDIERESKEYVVYQGQRTFF